MNSLTDRFGRIGFTAIFDSDMRIAWCNEKRLFRKIASSEIFMKAYRLAAEDREPFENKLRHNGIVYKAVFIPVADRRYLCIAYPEDRFIRFAYSEMYMRIFNIRSCADKMIAGSPEISDAAKKCGVADEVMMLIDDQRRFAESVKYDADGIAKIYDADSMCEYVSIRGKIGETFRNIRKYNSILSRNITFDADIECSVAKINYSVFEAAVLGIVRMMYKVIPKDGSGCIIIRGRRESGLRITTSCGACSGDVCIKDIDYEIRDVKCAFEYLGGKAEIKLGENGLSVTAAAPANHSNFNCRVKSYELTDTPEDDPYEILSGYTGLTVEELKHTEGAVQFRCQVTEPEYLISEMLADAMLRPLAEEMNLDL